MAFPAPLIDPRIVFILWIGYPVILGLWTYRKPQLGTSLKAMLYLFVLSFYLSFLSPLPEIALLAREYLWFTAVCPLLYIPRLTGYYVLILSRIPLNEIFYLVYYCFVQFTHPTFPFPPMIDYRIYLVVWCAIFGWYYVFSETRKKREDRFLDWVFKRFHWKPPSIVFPFVAFATFPAVAFWKL